jgi:probable F420-dependent oxidoreductase
MKIDAAIVVDDPLDAGPAAARLERRGYDGGFVFEGRHDPFLPLLAAAAETERLELGTGVAIAFARNPMLLANLGYDLQLASKGRFWLGLGTQIRPHIERRFSSTWSRPAARMRELVLAIRAIWHSWEHGERLDFRGEFYTHTLMTPVFDPGPNPFGPPPIFAAGVGRRMTEVAGEVADGFLVHPFHTDAFVRQTTVPSLERGLAKAGRERASLQIAAQVIVATGADDETIERASAGARAQISFYASTPAYRPVLESIGRGELQEELNAMSKRGEWLEMAGRIDDDLLRQIAVVGPPDVCAAAIRERFGFANRIAPVSPAAPDPEAVAAVAQALRQQGG